MTAVVLDSGSWEVKVGRAGEVAPRLLHRTVVGRCKSAALREAEGRGLLFGAEALENEHILDLLPLGEDPVGTFAKSWEEALCNEYQTRGDRLPLCLVRSVFFADLDARMVESVFESLAAPRLLLLDAGAAGVLSEGRVTGLSLDIGEAAAVAMPVFEGLALTNEKAVSGWGGGEFRRKLRGMVDRREVSDSALDVLRAQFCSTPEQSTFEVLLPDKAVAQVERASLRALNDETGDALVALREQYPAGRVSLQGGGALLPSLAARLGCVFSSSARTSAWLGASLFASMGGAAPLFVSKAVYEEHGAEQVIAKNFQ